MRRFIKFFFLCVFSLITIFSLFSQEKSLDSVNISYSLSSGFYMVERADLSRYDNGRYTGLTSREVRSFINPISAPSKAPSFTRNNQWYKGNFAVLEETKTNMRTSARRLEGMIPSTFYIADDGTLTVYEDKGFPSLRSFPAFPTKTIHVGDTWQAEGKRAVDPLYKGKYTKLPILVEYKFVGEEVYKNEDVYRIKAKWATRYGNQFMDYEGDPNLLKATGTHDADIIVLKDTGAAIFIRDTMDETYFYVDGSSVRLKGTSLLFTEFPTKLEKEKIIQNLNRIATIKKNTFVQNEKDKPIEENKKINKTDTQKPTQKTKKQKENIINNTVENKQNIVVEQTDVGLRLSVRDIRFIPDSSEILPEEKWRLDEIAKILVLAKDSQFLIEGHTASVGNPEGEMELSIERAHKIADELSSRGIDASKFLFMGYGGTKPIDSNTTQEGMAKNRRVEITIIE